MNPILRNVLVIINGAIGGSIINIALIKTRSTAFPIAGIDPNEMEAFAAVMPL